MILRKDMFSHGCCIDQLNLHEWTLLKSAPPVMRSSTSLHCNNRTGRKLTKGIQQLSPGNITVKCNASVVHPDADLKYIFSQIDTNDFYRIHDAVSLK